MKNGQGSQGDLSYVNTHPFVRRSLGRGWVFAHNGTLPGIEGSLELKFLRPVGETDSEYAFCYLLEKISEGSEEEIPERILEGAQEISELGTFNFLLSDGKHLFAYTGAESGEGMLSYIIRRPPHRGMARLLDEDYEISLEEMKRPDERAAMIATQRLSDEVGWRWLEAGSLYVFEDGELRRVLRP